MLKLCGFRISNYHNKVRLALLEKGVPFEEDPSCFPSQKDEWVGRSPMGKVPILEADGTTLSESEVICEYLEDAFPQKPLLPKDPVARARVRELITHLELHMELVARRLYGAVFFGGKASDETREQVQKELAKGVRTLQRLAKFDPYIAGPDLTLADCAAFVHLPLISLATKLAYGADALEGVTAVKPYLKMLGERPAFARVNEDRKAAQEAARARAK
ncbi:MAG TPA: glutathione S-transferase N-terminal domain-containing protein [Burkholderiales bacterium]|jgi:glutathione S-transferase|nr:glutathione S-transferase N-terminal domain-containing protein [Burkholderiales bacterium]